MRRRVVITGIGCINPMGNDVETMWSGLKESQSGVGYTSIFDASRFPTRISAEIKTGSCLTRVKMRSGGSFAVDTLDLRLVPPNKPSRPPGFSIL